LYAQDRTISNVDTMITCGPSLTRLANEDRDVPRASPRPCRNSGYIKADRPRGASDFYLGFRASFSPFISLVRRIFTMSPPLIVPAVRRHTATVIFVHGLGDEGAGWVDLAENWRRRSKFSETKFVFPNAPSIPITVVRLVLSLLCFPHANIYIEWGNAHARLVRHCKTRRSSLNTAIAILFALGLILTNSPRRDSQTYRLDRTKPASCALAVTSTLSLPLRSHPAFPRSASFSVASHKAAPCPCLPAQLAHRNSAASSDYPAICCWLTRLRLWFQRAIRTRTHRSSWDTVMLIRWCCLNGEGEARRFCGRWDTRWI